MMKFKKHFPKTKISICAGALQSVFDECDRYDQDETGGRIIGTYKLGGNGALEINVSGIIEPGPNARRSATSFYQDGEHQARVFRDIENAHPQIEHLGNWHTHHVNGYPTLSRGDIDTYTRIVNHDLHNLDFFYALLVVKRIVGKTGLNRYRIRHYVLFRGNDSVVEVEPRRVTVTDKPTIWPKVEKTNSLTPILDACVRTRDKATIENLYPDFRAYQSSQLNMFYWRGTVCLVDGSVIQLTIPEIVDDESISKPYYQTIAKYIPENCSEAATQIQERCFQSASEAIYKFEQTMNKSLYEGKLQAAE